MSKFKKKKMAKVKQSFGLDGLFFYLGTEFNPENNIIFSKIICSIKKNKKDVYRGNANIVVDRRLDHREIEHVMNCLSGLKTRENMWLMTRDQYGKVALFVDKVLFEQTNSEISDLASLKKAYLIICLSGLS